MRCGTRHDEPGGEGLIQSSKTLDVGHPRDYANRLVEKRSLDRRDHVEQVGDAERAPPARGHLSHALRHGLQR